MSTPKTPLKFKARSAEGTDRKADPWTILVVDDDQEVHTVTQLILGKLTYKNRGVRLLSAYSSIEAREVLEREKNIAVVLLDVVMETDDAGLRLVRIIREDLANPAIRIILRTGQPGQAPEERVIVDYDINDYKAKNELTAQKLFTTVVASLRSYETIQMLEKNRRGMEKILNSSADLFQVRSLQEFASGVLTQMSSFLDCRPNGVICMRCTPDGPLVPGLPAGPTSRDGKDLEVLACSGDYADYPDGTPEASPAFSELLPLVYRALDEGCNQYTADYTVLYLNTGTESGTAALLRGGHGPVEETDRQLLEVFASKISIAMANAMHYQKMVSAEKAATTDYLTGLSNRRNLLNVGIPLISGAHRAGHPVALAVMDIDRFKSINDTYGHDGGDVVLRELGKMLKDRFRTSDVVARFGGEEFCVITPDTELEAARALFDGFRQAVESHPFQVGDKTLAVTISIGVSGETSGDIDTMITRADEMLYKAKNDGRNRVVVVGD